MSADERTATRADDVTYVPKACAYITRNGERDTDGNRVGDGRELLVFEGPGHEGLQIPKGTIESGETPREAVFREVAEESGLGALADPRHLATDVWTRRRARRYVRHFFHATVHDPRDRWTHTVTGEGEETGAEYEFSWVELPSAREFALALDDYVELIS